MPTLPPDIERTNPTLAVEFDRVTKNLRTLTSQIALLDRIHSIKVGRLHAMSVQIFSTCLQSLQPIADHWNGPCH